MEPDKAYGPESDEKCILAHRKLPLDKSPTIRETRLADLMQALTATGSFNESSEGTDKKRYELIEPSGISPDTVLDSS